MMQISTTDLSHDSLNEVHVNLSSGNLATTSIPLETANISASLSSGGFTVRDIPKGEYDLEDVYPDI